MNSVSAPGYWCECTMQHTTNDPTFTATFAANSPQQAVRWIRVALRTITPALDTEAADQARQWLDNGHTQAITDLNHGEPCTLTLRHGTAAVTWTTRPVLFLPLAHRQGNRLPPCAEQFPDPQQHHTATE